MNEIYDDDGNIYIWSTMENCLKKINKDENIRTKDIFQTHYSHKNNNMN